MTFYRQKRLYRSTLDSEKWRHLIADEVDVLLNLGHPLPEDSEQLWYGGAGIQKDLFALRLAGVKEGELWRRRNNRQTG